MPDSCTCIDEDSNKRVDECKAAPADDNARADDDCQATEPGSERCDNCKASSSVYKLGIEMTISLQNLTFFVT